MQRGRAIVYINGASGTISGNKVYDFQKSGIEVNGLAVDGGIDRASQPDLRDGARTTPSPDEGDIDEHRSERHRDPERRERHREQATPSATSATRRSDTEATGVLLYRRRPGQRLRTTRSPPTRLAIDDVRPAPAEATSGPNLRPHNTDRGLHAEAPVFLHPEVQSGSASVGSIPVRRLAPRPGDRTPRLGGSHGPQRALGCGDA